VRARVARDERCKRIRDGLEQRRRQPGRDDDAERIAQPAAEMDYERARIAMMKALIRLQVASRARTRA